MNRTNLDFLVPMFPFAHFSDFNILIVNQTTEENTLTSAYPSVRVINSFERGLSRSRNLLVKNASKKIGYITDDDLVFLEGFDQKIVKGCNHYPKSAAVKFVTVNFEGIPFRKYPNTPVQNLNALWRLNSTSWEIALNIDIVRHSNVQFDTRFGLGSTFPLGEEPVLLNKLHDAGHTISHYPETIVSHKTIKDSDLITLQENYRIRGAYLAQIFKHKFLIWLGVQLAYDLKSGKVKPWRVFSCIQYAFKGKNQLKITHEDNA